MKYITILPTGTTAVALQYLKKGYGVYLDALHKDHLEVRGGEICMNLDGILNPDKTNKALGRVVKGWK